MTMQELYQKLHVELKMHPQLADAQVHCESSYTPTEIEVNRAYLAWGDETDDNEPYFKLTD